MDTVHSTDPRFTHWFVLALMCTIFGGAHTDAQLVTPTPNDTLHSVMVSNDFRITFRIYAPKAAKVTLGGSDIPEPLRMNKMVKQENGVWEVTVGPVNPGAYRYNFIVDDVQVVDPRNPATSESNMNAWSLIYVPGSPVMDTREVPHGAVAEVAYYSTALKRFRRMHVYTPPGYETVAERYPVFYLLHGAWDSDDAWPTVGRAGFILDNLIADKKVLPMIVVMPAGHTGPFTFNPSTGFQMQEFLEDFAKDVRPYAEAHYRVLSDRNHRAIAGLSMGGAQTLDLAIPHLEDYGYIGVFSSGLFELGQRPDGSQQRTGPGWEERNSSYLDNKQSKEGLRLLWFATGKEDFLVGITRSTVDLFKHHGFDVMYKETSGGHTWINWREYLAQFAPLLFR